MSRSPLPAWRRLFAIGGGPATTHAALSRAPAPERLLEPMTRMGLAAETSLDALVRPLDVSAVLSRALEGAAIAPGKVSEESEVPMRARTALARHNNTAAASRTELESSRRNDRVRASATVLPERVMAKDDDRPAVARTPGSTHENVASANVMPRVTAARGAVAFAGRTASSEAQSGALARVVVDGPVAGIERLLAIGDPSATPARQRRSAVQSTGPAMEASVPNAARTLADAVDRVAARRAESLPALHRGAPLRPGATHHETLIAEQRVVAGRPAAENVTAIVNDAPSSGGGFRGLARRTLVANGAAQHIPVRLEPEPRVPTDLPLDTLDARVAESLARILEREARRHGVDLAESRT